MGTMSNKRVFLLGLACALAGEPVLAKPEVAFGPAGSPDWPMEKWTAFFRKAPKSHSFKGVFVVAMPNVPSLASSRITHVVRRKDVLERIEALTGQARVTYRHNEMVATVFPDAKVVRHERLGSWGGVFPGTGAEASKAAPSQYKVIPGGRGRIAGHETYRVDFQPVDQWRFGYRIWPEVRTGLVLKLQTLNADGRVIEQSEFSELAFNAGISAETLDKEMKRVPPGYKVLNSKAVVTTAAKEGWQVRNLPEGFEAVTCYKRADQKASRGWLQCVFSDGMASASVFLERYDPERHRQEGMMAMGATHTVVARSVDADKVEWWATVVGEAPPVTLETILRSMNRLPTSKPSNK